MAKIIVEHFIDTNETSDTILQVAAVRHYNTKSIAASLKRILGAAKAMWPDDPLLKRIHIVVLPEEK